MKVNFLLNNWDWTYEAITNEWEFKRLSLISVMTAELRGGRSAWVGEQEIKIDQSWLDKTTLSQSHDWWVTFFSLLFNVLSELD